MSSTVMGLLLPTALGLFLAAIAVAFGDINLLFPHNRLKENGGESNTVIGAWAESDNNNRLCDNFIRWRRNAYSSGTTYGSKTGYLFKERVIQDESSVKHNECRIVQIYGVYRHGTRSPLNKYTPVFKELQENIDALDVLSSSSRTPSARRVKEWRNPFSDPVQASLLTESGFKEKYCLAKRLRQRFKQLFQSPYSPDWYSFQSTHKVRTIQSAESFAHGLFDGTGPLNGFQPIALNVNSKIDPLLRFFDACDLYNNRTKRNQTVKDQYESFIDQPVVKSIRDNVQDKLDPNHEVWNITTRQLSTMYEVCASEMAIYGHSVLCSLFENSVLEYKDDLKQYTLRGHASDLNGAMTCKLFDDVLTSMQSTVSNFTESPRVVLRFAHAETLIPMVTAFGLYKDKEPLLATNYDAQKERLFRTREFGTFGANIVFALYDCTKDGEEPDYKIRILLNEKPIVVKHRQCDQESPFFCPYRNFSSILNEISSQQLIPCKFEELCALD